MLIRETVHHLLTDIWKMSPAEWEKNEHIWNLHQAEAYRVVYTSTRDLSKKRPPEARTEFFEERDAASASIMNRYPNSGRWRSF